MRYVETLKSHRSNRSRAFRSGLTAAASVVGLLAAGGAYAADPTPQTAQAAPVEEIVVTGTRVIRDGYEAPTPVSVLSADDLALSGRNNISETVSKLPAMSNSVLPHGTASTQNVAGTTGISNLNLRGLGATRTLVLLDGARVVGSNLTANQNNGGAVDVNMVPDGLLQRVDVVTGGASAAYGSDALSGVVNFVLDHNFVGVKGSVEGGVTTYGDDRNYKITLSAGLAFANDRGHLLIYGQDSFNDGIKGGARPWRQADDSIIIANPGYTATSGQPQYIVRNNVGIATATHGGLIVSGPLKGIQFGPGGTPSQYQYGSIVSGTYMVGGEWQPSRIDNSTDLDFRLRRQNLFARLSYEVADGINVYGVLQWYQSQGTSAGLTSGWNLGNLTVKADNAFIPAPVAAQMAALKLTSFALGTMNNEVGQMIQDNGSLFGRWVVGADGSFDALDTNWKWDAYAQRSTTHISSNNRNVIYTAHQLLAIDAVRSPTTGAIVCRSTLTDPTNGCVPYNVMGLGVNSQAAIDYVSGDSHGNTTLAQNVYAASATGEPFSSWAGPVSLALGVEHRREEVTGHPSPLDETNSYFAGNYHASKGSFNVTEGFVETVIPLAKNTAWAKSFDLNGSIRATDYSTSGYVTTWKVGATYSPLNDMTFRATRSRDIRAPNLGDLFNAGRVGVSVVNDPLNGGAPISIFAPNTGNPLLKPEVADTTGFGVVLQPQFFPGFSASADYYKIDISGAITGLGAQSYLDRCTQGITYLCQFIFRNAAGQLTQINVQPANILSQTTSGLDMEASYNLPLSSINADWDGDIRLRGLGTYVFHLRTVDQQQIIEGAGINVDSMGGITPSNGYSAPSFRYSLTATYSNTMLTTSVTYRGMGSGKINNALIACTSGCPASTGAHPTIDTNFAPGASYWDASFSYKVTPGTDVFLSIENVMNTDPPYTPGSTGSGFYTGIGSNYQYEILGRIFHAGVRFKM